MIKRNILLIGSLLVLLGWSTPMSAQGDPSPFEPLPIDSAIHVGQLPNGLTYYVRHHANPERRADFYLAQRVGSILEQDEQRGLAHFLEHMAFNGTKNFPGKSMIHYLESIGVRFGSNLNAFTGFDETVYTIKDAPTTRQGIVDSCLLILHDWSHAITLDGNAIDNERKVIQEEWRSKDGPAMRNFTNILKAALPGNKYVDRIPIGNMDVVMNFKHDALRDYYHKWYRPDLQALIIVGDIDPDYVVAQLHEIFKDVPKPVNPAERVYTKVETANGPLMGIATDPEESRTKVMITYKIGHTLDKHKSTLLGLALGYSKRMIIEMLSARFAEIAKQPDAPFFSANVSFGPYMGVTKTMDAMTFEASIREGHLEEGIKALITEIVRVRDHGFTQGEYNRARHYYSAKVDQMYNERDKRTNGQLAGQCVNAFTKGAPLCDIETYHKYMTNYLDFFRLPAINITVANYLGRNTHETSPEKVREMLADNLKGTGIFITGPKKEGVTYPTYEELKDLYLECYNRRGNLYKKEAKNDQPLRVKTPTKGSIVKEVKDGKYGATVWTLGNGAEVIFKVTDYMDDQIIMMAQKNRGLASLGDTDIANAKLLTEVAKLGGLGTFDRSMVRKNVSGTVYAEMNPSITLQHTIMEGKSNREGLDSMMQLMYLNFTAQRSNEKAFEVYRQKKIEALKMAEHNPLRAMADSVLMICYPDSKIMHSFKAEDFEQVSYPRILELYQSFFKSASGFKFFFVGNIDEATFRDYVETYIASLPGDPNEPPTELSNIPKFRTGNHVTYIPRRLSVPIAFVINIFSGQTAYNRENLLRLNILSEVMTQIYTAFIRQIEGGSYDVDVKSELNRQPEGETSLSVAFQTAPERALPLNYIIIKELSKVVKNGPNRAQFDNVINNMLKKHGERVKTNVYWLEQLINYYVFGDDFNSDYEKVLRSITPDSVADFARQLLDQNNYINMIVYTEGHTLRPVK